LAPKHLSELSPANPTHTYTYTFRHTHTRSVTYTRIITYRQGSQPLRWLQLYIHKDKHTLDRYTHTHTLRSVIKKRRCGVGKAE
jgi:hypothetical protein